MTRRGRWVSALDVERAGSRMVTALGPIAVPDDDELARVVADIVDTAFDTKLATTPSMTSLRWHPTAQPPPILRCPAVGRDGLDEVLTLFHRETTGLGPLAIGVAGAYLLVSVDHGWGDGHVSVRLSKMLSERTSEPAPPQRRFPLFTAAGRFFVRNPGAAVHALRAKLRGAAPADPAGPADARPWAPGPRVVSASVDADALDGVRRWRADTGTDVSVSAVLTAATIRELDRAGVAHHPGVRILFDCRRYVAELRDPLEIVGNFVGGVDFSLPGTPSAVDIGDQIRAATATGRPLLSMAVSTAHAAASTLARRPRPQATEVAAPVRARLTFSDVGRTPFSPSIWTGDVGERFFNTLSEPSEPDGIVVTFIQAGGGLTITASFHDTVFDPETLRDALRRVARTPVYAVPEGVQQ